MARDFVRASSQYIWNANAILTGEPLTIACWGNCDNIANGQHAIAITRSASNSGWYILGFGGGAVGDPVQAGAQNDAGSLTGVANSTTGYSQSNWHHACAVFTNTASRHALIDGGSKGTNTTDIVTSPSVNRSSIGARFGSGVNNAYDGSLAEVGVWSVALTDDEVISLAKGFSPPMVRPSNLVFYMPLVRDNDEDIIGGLSYTAVASPTIDAHPRVFYPHSQITIPPIAPSPVKVPVAKIIRSDQVPVHQLQL